MDESVELRELIIGCFDALATGDADWFDCHVVRGRELRLIGATSEEFFGGLEGFELLRQQAASGRGELRATTEQVEAYADGDVGWGAAVIRYEYGPGKVAVGRETFVSHRVRETWKLAQAHTSFPVSP